MFAQPSVVAQRQPASQQSLRVVVVGGGFAAGEALLALRDLAGERVSRTLVCPNDELVLPALTVPEPFALATRRVTRSTISSPT
jgi:NADH dehydrogenase FAD-containing subunit